MTNPVSAYPGPEGKSMWLPESQVMALFKAVREVGKFST